MKCSFRSPVFASFVLFKCVIVLAQETPKTKIVETINFKTSLLDRIVLTNEVYDRSENMPGSFKGALFEKNEKVIFSLPDVGGYDAIDSYVLHGIKNKINSSFVLIISCKDINYFIFQGFQFGCCPKYLVIVKEDKSGLKEIANLEFELAEIKKIKNGDIMVFGHSSFSQGLRDIDSLDISLSSYSPTLIYNLTKDFQLDSAFSKKYNEENYVFAGFKYSEKVIVARQRYNRNRKIDSIKPYIFKPK